MHEMSIAVGLVEAASERAGMEGAHTVRRVFLKIGALSGVVPDAMRFAFDVAAAGTRLEGAELVIDEVAVTVFCPGCREEKTTGATSWLECPDCGALTPDVLRGRELELTALELTGLDRETEGNKSIEGKR